MKIVELNPFQQLRWVCRQGADEWIGTDICFDLQSGDKATLLSAHPEVKGQLEQQVHNNTTLLVFRHSNWKDYTPMFAECNYTWAQFLRSLKLYSETGTGRLWPQQHHGT